MNGTSLRHALTRASLLATVMALLLSSVLLLGNEFFSYRRDRLNDLQVQARLLAEAVTPALAFDDEQAAVRSLSSLEQKADIEGAAVYRSDGARFATHGAPTAERAPEPFEGRGRFHRSTAEVLVPVIQRGEHIGDIYLRSRHALVPVIGLYAAILCVTSLLALAAAHLLFRRLQRRVTQPLEQVTQVARQVIEQRDWQMRAPGSDIQDIALLVSAFNDLLDEVGRTTAELGQAKDDLLEADRRKDEFIATLAHELRNPLAPMRNAVALLGHGPATPDVHGKAVAILDRQLRHVVRLMDDLLDISRITTGKLSLKLEHTDLVPVALAATELADPLVRARRQTLVTHLPDARCPLDADPARLQQVFTNLLTNACRYTPEGGHIELALQCVEGGFEVSVSDNGIGIDASMHQRVFELFEQADKSTERGNVGLGLGLTLARQLVRLHGGEITLNSDGVGRGSVFTVHLPAARQDVADALPHRAAPPPPAPVLPAAFKPLHLLVADDNADFLDSLQEVLRGLGHRVRTARDGEAALAMARSEPPDVAILDIGMPRRNGYDVATALRADPALAGTWLVAVTGWGQPNDRARAAAAGFDHHLIKPVHLPDLLAALSHAAASRPPASPPFGSTTP